MNVRHSKAALEKRKVFSPAWDMSAVTRVT